MRLQKFMADAGIASRRKCEEYIAEGRVKVNGNTAVIGCTVEDGDEVLFDGNPVCGKTAYRFFAFPHSSPPFAGEFTIERKC